MLLIEKKQVSVKDIEKLLGVSIPLDKLLKKPLFEINPANLVKDPDNGPGAVKCRQGIDFPASFRVRLKNGTDVEIRYCTNRTPDLKTHGQTEIYTPKKLPFDGKAEYLSDDQDKAVYYYLHFFNKQSPFRNEGMPFYDKPYEFEFQDDQAKATVQIAAIQLRSKAVAHAASLEGEELLIIAKGMRVVGVHGMDDLMVKAKLMEYAERSPKEYIDKANSQVNHIEGLILDAIDKGVFELVQNSSGKTWKWAMGNKKDQVIVELSNNVQNTPQALITHIQQTPGVVNEFLPSLLDARLQMAAKKNINHELQGVNVLDMVKQSQKTESAYDGPTQPSMLDNFDSSEDEPLDLDDFEQPEVQLGTLPETFKEAQDLLGQKGCSKAPSLAKELMTGIENKTITAENIEDFFVENKKE